MAFSLADDLENNKDEAPPDKIRYRRILLHFAGVIGHIIWWDLLVRRLPLLGEWVTRTRPQRYRNLSASFRVLAIDMGGVLIKLGQFLSTRVDILPIEITEELKGLQDEVPPVPTWQMQAILHRELGDLDDYFAEFDHAPIAAASLGQAYRARLHPTPNQDVGESVVVKVQRPNIEEIVQTDLAALRVVARWVMRYRPIRRRADVPELMEEFAVTLWEELDYKAEIENAHRFADMYANSERIYIPAVYPEHCTERVVVLEDVESLNIGDIEGMKSAGIDPKEVADVLLEAYFQQVFKESFFHADPHPGNLFVRPRTDLPWEPEVAEGEEGGGLGRPFWLIFIDFGMVGRLPATLNSGLRELVISVVQQDAYTLTKAYNDLGFFLPGADLDRITEAQEAVLERVYGRDLLELARPDPAEIEELGKQFQDLLFDFPFQIPQDFIYLGRAISIVSGLVSSLNPTINPWYQIEKFGKDLLEQQVRQELSLETVTDILRPYLDLPGRVQRLLAKAENGRLRVQIGYERENEQRLDRLEKRVGRLNWGVMGAASIISATLLYLRRKE